MHLYFLQCIYLRWLSKTLFDFESKRINNTSDTGKQIIYQLLNLIAILDWFIRSTWDVINIKLNTVLAFLGVSTITLRDETKQISYVSLVLCGVIERIPNDFISHMIYKWNININCIKNVQCTMTISYRWILAILSSLARAMQFELLYDVTIRFGNRIANNNNDTIANSNDYCTMLFGSLVELTHCLFYIFPVKYALYLNF